MLDKRWETQSCKCNIDNNTGKSVSGLPKCNSLIIPQVINQPLDADLAKRIVEDHNQQLVLKGLLI